MRNMTKEIPAPAMAMGSKSAWPIDPFYKPAGSWSSELCSKASSGSRSWKWISTGTSPEFVRFSLCSFGNMSDRNSGGKTGNAMGFWIGQVSHVSWSTLCLRMPPKFPACSATSALARHSLNWWDRAALNILKPLHFNIQTNTKISKSDQKSMHKNPIPQL